MPNWAITGNLGGGKSLVAVGKMVDALKEGRMVATNIDMDLSKVLGKYSRATYIRIPDKPGIADLQAIGIGNASYDEERNGVLALDELGTWFNSRDWQDKTRKPVNDWFLHMRKYGWDGLFIIQHVENLDSQARRSLIEMTAFCRRMDRIRVPFIGAIKAVFTGKALMFPKLHRARVVYGHSSSDLMVDRWTYRGTDLYSAYDTKQVFVGDYPHGTHSVLSPWHLNRRQQAVKNREFYMRLTRIYWKRFKQPVAMAVGVLLGVSAAVLFIGKSKIDSYKPIASANASVEVMQELKGKGIVDQSDYDRLADSVSKLSIIGSMTVNGFREYHLASASESDRVVTSTQLASMGVIVRSRGDCSMVAQVGSRDIPLYCTF